MFKIFNSQCFFLKLFVYINITFKCRCLCHHNIVVAQILTLYVFFSMHWCCFRNVFRLCLWQKFVRREGCFGEGDFFISPLFVPSFPCVCVSYTLSVLLLSVLHGLCLSIATVCLFNTVSFAAVCLSQNSKIPKRVD